MKIRILFVRPILLIFFTCIWFTSSAQWIKEEYVQVNLSVSPPTLRVKGSMMDFDLNNMVITQTPQNDINNTQIISLRFKCVGPNNNIAPYDTTFPLNATFPFDLRIYGIHDTSILCYYPPAPVLFDSLYLTASQILSIEQTPEQSKLVSLYPNPAKGFVNIKADDSNEIMSVAVYDALGKLVISQENNLKTIDVQFMPAGLYFVTLITNSGVITKKLQME